MFARSTPAAISGNVDCSADPEPPISPWTPSAQGKPGTYHIYRYVCGVCVYENNDSHDNHDNVIHIYRERDRYIYIYI